MREDGGAADGRAADNRAADDWAADDWDGVVLDESFIRGAEAKEQSARARMLAARWRKEAPEPQPWRADKPPAGWFFGRRGRRLR